MMQQRTTLRVIGALLLSGLLGGALAPVLVAQNAQTDLALALAIDCSYSVDADEYHRQMQGLGRAIMSAEVIEAIAAGRSGRIAVAAFLWSDDGIQRVIQPWAIIDGTDSARALGENLAASPRSIAEGGTGISSALFFGADLFDYAPSATRRVIDLSTDGRNNMGAPAPIARDTVVARGITINGLAIANEWPTLETYLENQIAGGQGSFVMKAQDYDDFSTVMLKKLVKEITGPGVT